MQTQRKVYLFYTNAQLELAFRSPKDAIKHLTYLTGIEIIMEQAVSLLESGQPFSVLSEAGYAHTIRTMALN